MAGSYRPYEPDQVMLLPAAPQDWLPAGHLAHFINDTVDALDLGAFYARYEGGGSRNQPFHPAMMVKVLVYGYATGVFSSRKMERRLHEDLAFRMLAAGNFPRHRTICDFRAFHLKELSQLFVQVVRLAREMGLVKLGTVAIDGTKIKANASRHKAMSYERMQQAVAELKAQIDALLERAKAADEAETREPELDLPAEMQRREVRLAAIREARERLEQRQRELDLERGRSDDDDRRPRGPDGKPSGGRYKREFGVPEDKAQDNFTDPDSRIMKRAGGGFDPAYNAQTAVDETAHIIVAAELVNTAPDANWLLPMVRPGSDEQPRRVARSGVGRRGLPQRREPEEHPGRAGGGTGPRGQKTRRDRRQAVPVHRYLGRQAENRRRQGGLPQTKADRRATERLDQERAGFPAVQHARAASVASRVEARVHGTESAAHGFDGRTNGPKELPRHGKRPGGASPAPQSGPLLRRTRPNRVAINFQPPTAWRPSSTKSLPCSRHLGATEPLEERHGGHRVAVELVSHVLGIKWNRTAGEPARSRAGPVFPDAAQECRRHIGSVLGLVAI